MTASPDPTPTPPRPTPSAPPHTELTDRQVEVLVYRVLAAVIAFLIAAGAAVLLNSAATEADDQQVGLAVVITG